MSAVAVAGRAQRDEELFELSAEGDPAAREALVARFLPMAHRLALRYRRRGEPAEDLVQVACMGLVKAVERFDHRHGAPFVSYAVPTIVGELKRHLRDTSWAAYVPQRMRERVLEVEHATERQRRALGRSPTTGEVASDLGVEPADVLEAAEAATAHDAVSLDAPVPGQEGEASRGDALGAHEERYDLVEYEVTLGPAIRALNARQRVILCLRFEEDMTQSEIAALLGISQMHVSRLLRQALARLRAYARVRYGT